MMPEPMHFLFSSPAARFFLRGLNKIRPALGDPELTMKGGARWAISFRVVNS